MIVELWNANLEELAKNSHVNSERVHGVCEVAVGQNVIDQIDHALERVVLALVHDLEYERGNDVKALTVAH